MQINDQGTFYVEGEYKAGETILTAGDWELRANGSKTAFGYTPDTFVRRNLLRWSEDFNNIAWYKTGASVAPSEFAAPDGSSTASVIEVTGGGGYLRQDFAWEVADYSITVYVKKSNTSTFFIRNVDIGVASFDLDNITVTSGTGSITPVGNGWLKCVASYDNGVASTRSLRLFAGTTLGHKINIWGAQLEQSSEPSDYQRTTTVVPKPTDGTLTLGNGHHKDFRYYPYKLSEAEITELTR